MAQTDSSEGPVATRGTVGLIYGNLARLMGGKAIAGLVSLLYMVIALRALGVRDYGVLILVHTYTITVGGIIAADPEQMSEGFALGDTAIAPLGLPARAGLTSPGAMYRSAGRVRFADPLRNPEPVIALPSHQLVYADEVGQAHLRLRFKSGDGAIVNGIAFRSIGQKLGNALTAHAVTYLMAYAPGLAGSVTTAEGSIEDRISARLLTSPSIAAALGSAPAPAASVAAAA